MLSSALAQEVGMQALPSAYADGDDALFPSLCALQIVIMLLPALAWGCIADLLVTCGINKHVGSSRGHCMFVKSIAGLCC